MSKTTRVAMGLMTITMFSKILGFLREMILASTYGAGIISDAYIMAMNIPSVIFALVGSALATSYIPLYTDISQNKCEEEALRFSNNILTIVAFLSILMITGGLLFTEEIVKLFAGGYDGEKLILTIEFTKVLFLSIGFIGATYIVKSFLETKGNFIIPGLTGIPYNVIVISSILISKYTNKYILVWGTLIGIAFQFLTQVPYAIKNGYKYKFVIDIKDKYFNKMLILVAPILVGASVNQFNTMVDRALATTLVNGSVSALNYANRLNQFVMGVFIVSITSVIYPLLSNLSSKNNSKQFNESIKLSLNSVIVLVMPVSIGAIVLSKPIVKLLFERGAFTPQATEMTSVALTCYSIGLLAIGIRDVLTKAFYALQDTKTPMKNGVIAVIINIILNFLLIKNLKVGGLALATSISATVGAVLLFIDLSKKHSELSYGDILTTIVKTFISSLIMGFAVNWSYNRLTNILGVSSIGLILALVVSILIGFAVYLSSVVILKVDTADYVIVKIKNVLLKKYDKE